MDCITCTSLGLVMWGTSRISESWRREARASSTRASVWQWLPSLTEGHNSCPLDLLVPSPCLFGGSSKNSFLLC